MSARILERVTVYKADDHDCNQAIVTELADGEVVAVFNEERGLAHRDNGYTSLVRSRDGGQAEPGEPTWWHSGYPSTTQLRDGSLVTVYHLFSRDRRPVQYIEAVRWELG